MGLLDVILQLRTGCSKPGGTVHEEVVPAVRKLLFICVVARNLDSTLCADSDLAMVAHWESMLGRLYRGRRITSVRGKRQILAG